MLIGTYNIQVVRGLSTSRSLLSCSIDGKLHLWPEDDGSGRQRWELAREGDNFTLKVSGGTSPGYEYLRLFTTFGPFPYLRLGGYQPGLAEWRLHRLSTMPQIPSYYALSPPGQAWADLRLGCTPDGETVVVQYAEDRSGCQHWQFQGPLIPLT